MHFECSDKTADCLDGSDEGDHCKVRECDSAMFRCTDSGRCIPKVVVAHKKIILFIYKNCIYNKTKYCYFVSQKAWVCDGDRDCTNGEDGNKSFAICNFQCRLQLI